MRWGRSHREACCAPLRGGFHKELELSGTANSIELSGPIEGGSARGRVEGAGAKGGGEGEEGEKRTNGGCRSENRK